MFYTESSNDHGSLGQLFALVRRLPAAKKNMNSCTDVIFTVLKEYLLVYACKELGIENIDSDISLPIPTVAVKKKFP